MVGSNDAKQVEEQIKQVNSELEERNSNVKALQPTQLQDKMTKILKNYMDNVKVVVNTPLQLPKLNLPKLKKLENAER